MKFFLTSDTITDELEPKFEEFADLNCKDSTLAFIPNAGFGVGKDMNWIAEEFEYLRDQRKFKAEAIDIEKIKGDELFNTLKEFDVIYVNGGFSGYLLRKMREAKFDIFFPELLKAGAIYVGSSGGSVVVSNTNISAEWYLDEPEPGAAKEKGLGYYEYEIYPHFHEDQLSEIKKHMTTGEKYILLKDGQAVGLHNGEMTLFGEDIKILNK